MAKEIFFNEQAVSAMQNGMNELANSVKSTLGPKGRNVVISKKFGNPLVTKDGVSVSKEIIFDDEVKNIGAQIVKQAAEKTSDLAGDGTTTSTVLAQQIINDGIKNVTAVADPSALKRGIEKAGQEVIQFIRNNSTELDGSNGVINVATISANNDSEIGTLINSAMEKIGKDGVITIEEAKSIETSLEVVEGMQFDRGFISPYFITDESTMQCTLEDPIIVVIDKKLSALKDVIGSLDVVHKQGKPLFLIADDVDSEALTIMIVNKLRGIIKCCAVKAPGFGDRKKEMLKDIAAITGAEVISSEKGYDLETITKTPAFAQMLGFAKKIIVDKDTTTIIEGKGNKEEINARIAQIRVQIENATSDFDKDKLQERLGKLSQGVAVLKVGAATEIEMKEKKARVEDALHATRAAVEEGILPGGGIALLRASSNSDLRTNIMNQMNSEDEKTGAKILMKALEAPIRCIVENAGQDPSAVVFEIIDKQFNYGYNALTNTFVDMLETGIVDPTKVTRVALENAISVAGIFLTTNCAVVDKKEEKNCACNQNQMQGY